MPSGRDLARSVKRALRRLLSPGTRGVGSVRFGDLARTKPISRQYGFDRGRPIDRIYVEKFLAECSKDIKGRVLEVGAPTYSRRFGSGITKQDVLHVRNEPGATIVGDLSTPGLLPVGAFDCIILTQTLHLVYDMSAAVRELNAALAPGGVLLVTVPGVSAVDRGEWGDSWCWSLTAQSARRLFADVFGPENVTVESHGNVYAATCFLHGLAAEEAEGDWLAEHDPAYPVTIAVRARR